MTQTYTNAQILAAVLNQWANPLINKLVSTNLSTNPVISAIENRVRSTGWVSQRWNLTAELTPVIRNASSMIVEPILSKYISGIPDESIPSVAHGVVDEAVRQGELSLFEGNVVLDADDLKRLKRLLQLNLPLGESCGYEVITDKQTKQQTK